jgi:hypothetical protein
MTRRYCDPQWALLFEVLNATGAAHTRSADALAMSLWPSRGLDLHGFEIKVSRYDWLKEKAHPEKAEPIASYCDYWWLVTTPGVVERADEIPRTWGWFEFDGDHFTERKAPARLEAKVMDRRFLAALLRRAARTDEALLEAEIGRRDAGRKEQFDQAVERAVERRTADATAILKDVEAFEAASGVKISIEGIRGFTSQATDVGRAVKAILAAGIDKTYSGLFYQANALRDAAATIETALREHGFEPREMAKGPAASGRRRRAARSRSEA